MDRDRDTETGKFSEEYPDEAFLYAIDSLDMPSTNDVADFVGCSYTLTYHRLNELSDEGEISKIEIGNSFAWTK